MSLFTELIRLEARYAAAQVSYGSCPRNREILRAKIEDLRLELIGPIAVRAGEGEISEAELDRVRTALSEEPCAEPPFCLEIWQNEHIRLWEQGH